MNKISKISLFLFMSVLLTSGFPNYMSQEAFAHSVAGTPVVSSIVTTSTTTIVVTFNEHVNSTSANLGGDFTFSTGGAITTSDISGLIGADSITLTTDTAFGTGVIPTVGYTLNEIEDVDEDNLLATFSTASTDGVPPVFSSAATASSTQIDVTFTESMADPGATPGDFTIAGGLTNAPVVTAITVSGSDLQLTLSQAIVNGDTPTVTFTNTGARPTDASPATNNLADFGAQAVTNNVAVVVVQENNGGGSGCNDCESPTLGMDKSGKRLVSNGFTYNEHSVDVERFFTPYPLIKANVGQTNKADFKIYENEGPDNIKHLSFAFGLGNDQIISESKAMIELDIDWDGTETVTITDPENALDNVKVETYTISCDGDVRIDCLGVTIYHTFRAPLDFNIVATDVWDNSRNSWQNYYNHGIEVVGKSLNPAKEYDGINKGHIYHLTETSKTTAVDEFGNSWSLEYGLWEMDYIANKNTIVSLYLQKVIPAVDGFAGSDQFGTMYYLTETSKTTAVDTFGNVWSFDNDQWSMDEKYTKMILASTPMGGYTRADPEFDTYKYGQFLLAENKLTKIMGN